MLHMSQNMVKKEGSTETLQGKLLYVLSITACRITLFTFLVWQPKEYQKMCILLWFTWLKRILVCFYFCCWFVFGDAGRQVNCQGVGIAQWLERRTCHGKVVGSNPCRSGGRIFFSRVNFLCWLLFWYPFHPRVTAVAHKRSRSCCQKSRWQVTAKHAYTLRMWLCMKWHGAWLYGVHRTCAETAAVSCGTSHASACTPLWWIFKNVL